ncbi:MAG: diguanylate cyclase domain-containing protein, partial [Gemmatimonadales bacterium]
MRNLGALAGTTLEATLAALVAAHELLGDPADAVEAAEAIWRIAQTLKGHPATAGQDAIMGAVKRIEDAADAELAAAVEELIQAIRTVGTRPSSMGARILIVEDDTHLASLLSLRLQGPGREVVLVETAAAAERILDTEAVSLILLDLILPDADGRTLLLALRSDPRTAAVPIFVITAKVGNQPKTECLALGADGYFEKPLDDRAIAAATNTVLDRGAHLAREVRRDVVTGLPNRVAFREAFDRVRAGSELSLAMLDLDHFRWLNDRLGSQLGDAVLRRLGGRLAGVLREASCFARWDGGGFAALFAGGPEAPVSLLNQALEAARELDFAQAGETFQVTFSAGVTAVTPGTSLEDAIAQADRFLSIAKASGRNRVVGGDDAASAPVRRILIAEDDDSVARLVTHHLRREGFDVVRYK